MRELLLSLILFANIAQAETLYDYRIFEVIDGDTVNVMVDFLPRELGNIISIRILGIDTPEMRGKCINEIEKAKEAKSYLKELIKTDQYSIVIKGRDKYFRILGDIKIKDKYVSQLMLEKGYARRYNGKEKQSWCI